MQIDFECVAHESYRIEDGQFIVPETTARHHFPLGGRLTIVSDLAKVHSAADKSFEALNFCKTWGMLYLSKVRGVGMHRERVEYIWEHAKGFHEALKSNADEGHAIFENNAMIDVVRTTSSLGDKLSFPTLISAACWLLCDGLAKYNVVRCTTCQSLFFQTDQRQKYCPAPPYQKETQCGAKKRKKFGWT